jgi:hypothetical protein
MRERHRSGISIALALLLGLASASAFGCGRSGSDRTVARVGRSAISERAVRHWTAAFVHGGVEGFSLSSPDAAYARYAEEYLIASRWLLAEASRLDVAPTRQAVRERLAERREAVPGGGSAFSESLESSGRTVADVELEIEAALAAQALRHAVLARSGAISQAAVSAAYRRDIARYRTPERRYVDIVENLKSAAAAWRLARHVGTGQGLASLAFHEVQERPLHFNLARAKGRVVRAIFTARPGVLVGPMPLHGAWTLFVVRRIVPAGSRPLRAVRVAIARHLRTVGRVALLRRFQTQYKAHWTANTTCAPHYVVPGCAEYHGPPADHEDPLSRDPFL